MTLGRTILLALWVAVSGCAPETGSRSEPRSADEIRRERRTRRHHRRRTRRHRRPRVRIVRTGAPIGTPSRRVLRGVCAPVSSCGRFAGCGYAEEEPDPASPGDVRYRIRRYDPDPSRVDQIFEWSRLCWREGVGRACVDAFDDGSSCPSAVRPLATEAPPRCEVHGGVCGAAPTTTPAPDAGPSDDG